MKKRMPITNFMNSSNILRQTDSLINVENLEVLNATQYLLLTEVDKNSVLFNLESVYLQEHIVFLIVSEKRVLTLRIRLLHNIKYLNR